MKKLQCREFIIGFWPYRVFADGDEAVLVQRWSVKTMRDSKLWCELEGRHREAVIEYWREIVCSQLELFSAYHEHG